MSLHPIPVSVGIFSFGKRVGKPGARFSDLFGKFSFMKAILNVLSNSFVALLGSLF